MKNHIETTGNIPSEITSGITSLRKSHSLNGMAELFPEGRRINLISKYKLQTNFYKLKLKTKMKNLIKVILLVIVLATLFKIYFEPLMHEESTSTQSKYINTNMADHKIKSNTAEQK